MPKPAEVILSRLAAKRIRACLERRHRELAAALDHLPFDGADQFPAARMMLVSATAETAEPLDMLDAAVLDHGFHLLRSKFDNQPTMIG